MRSAPHAPPGAAAEGLPRGPGAEAKEKRPRTGCTTRCHAATGTGRRARDATPGRENCVTTTIASAPAKNGSSPTTNASSCGATTAPAPAKR